MEINRTFLGSVSPHHCESACTQNNLFSRPKLVSPTARNVAFKPHASYFIPHASYFIPHPSYFIFVLFIIFQFSILQFPLFAQETTFPQKIEWKSNANALEYRVEVQNTQTGATQTIKTEKTSTELSLTPGKYRYRVYAYDFLGKQASVSSWSNFEIFKANKPKINRIEQNLSVTNESNRVGIDVNIADVNQNSKFELISEGLEGSIPYSDRSKMTGNGSETDSVTHLDFSDVPPGRWRLRVTNASGLSTLSDVITVTGEKTYTEAQVDQIKQDAYNEAKKEFENNLEEYIKIVEAEKAAEAERIAREKAAEEEARRIAEAKAEQERIAREEKARREKEEAERIRLEQERRQRMEEQRIAQEKAEAERKAKEAEEKRIAEQKAREEAERIAKAEEEKRIKEEEKRRIKLEKKNKPYIWKDISLALGAGYSLATYDSTIKDYYDNSASLALNARLKMLPIKTQANKFGFEIGVSAQKFEKENEFLSSELISGIFDVKFVWQHKLVGDLFLSGKAGLGIDMLQKSVDYSETYVSGRNSPDDKNYFYPAVVGGVSLFYIPWKCIVLEAGADITHVFADSSPLGFIMPYACLGIRF